ncbi:MAG: metal ABC transporter ATP-binding protein [Thermoplasmatota archaeon]
MNDASHQRGQADAPVLQLRGAGVSYHGQPVLQDVDLDVTAGEHVAIVGPNGAGKTTLLKAALGLVPLATGTLRVFGRSVGRPGIRSRIAYVSQGDALHRTPASAWEVVLLGRVVGRGWLRRLTREDRDEAQRCLEAVGATHLARRQVSELSGGQRQRVLLARALASRPDFLVLDEPTTGLDTTARAELHALLDQLHDDGLTILHVTHHLDALPRLVDRVVLVDRTIQYDGPPTEVPA